MQSTAHYEWIERIGGTEMDPENASYPSKSDKSWSEATPSGQVSEDPWATEGFSDTEVMAGLERVGGIAAGVGVFAGMLVLMGRK
jgi:hypothetical protein